ncbi:hypothetical protein B0H17DRAFT_1145221 [Mycena rosella]|uniref:DUF6589 domain-containing protein n=1 Tax=Mycena rosella TaxID=1033263 RepID=A0AAD7G2I9_MYCRO|nr:hypothetical protein B0H17DRAFT_1145221 [Mycena rosella]
MPPKWKKLDVDNDIIYRAPSVSKHARQKQKQRETSFQARDTFFQTSSTTTSWSIYPAVATADTTKTDPSSHFRKPWAVSFPSNIHDVRKSREAAGWPSTHIQSKQKPTQIEWSHAQDLVHKKESTEQLIQCCIWQLEQLALENIANLGHLKAAFKECPKVDPIAVHKTNQYPLPVMHEDESSIEGTIHVYVQIPWNLGVTNENLHTHHLLFDDGDLLTNLLVEKPIKGMKASIHRFGLFHAKMAGCQLVLNEHWGKLNLLCPGSLWWKHTTLLKRKPLSAGWKAKKATPWKPSHELLQISMAAHIKDGFCIYCGQADLDVWASSATRADFDAITEFVYCKLFTAQDLDSLCSKPLGLHNITHKNIEFVSVIKGDIGHVVNILSVWMVMKQYDPVLKCLFLHNWLVNLTGHPYSFKEVDLLQEHQNFRLRLSIIPRAPKRAGTGYP